MVQAAESGHRYNAKPTAGTRFCRTAGRRFLHQRKMSSVIVVILDVFIHQALQVTFVDCNHMVKQIPAAVSNPSLCDTVLPRTSKTGPLGRDPETP